MTVIGRVELIDQVAARSGVARATAALAIDALLECVGDALRAGDLVRITGFGTFRAVETKERLGHDPRTKEPLTIPPGRRVLFSSGSRLRQLVLSDGLSDERRALGHPPK
jgi:DNA-binding protein HU-beta